MARGSLLSIHAGHLHIEQNDMVRITGALSVAQTLQSLCAAGHRVATTTQCFHVLRQDHAVGLIIVNDQDAHLSQIRGPSMSGAVPGFSRGCFSNFNVEPECAPNARRALDSDLSAHRFDKLL